jgi:protein-disulfide isomerase-like protein with CxxC motif
MHKEIRLYFRPIDYEVLESLASEEGLTVKDFILKLARDMEQFKAEIPTLRKLGVNCNPTRVVECITELKLKLLQRSLEYAACMEVVERLRKRGL